MAWAQTDHPGILYTKSSDFGILLHTRGYGLNYQWTRQRTDDNFQLFDISGYELRHPKEMALPNPLQDGSRSYVFGKLNNLVVFKFTYGTRKVLADRNLPNNIKVVFNYSAGPLVGWLKPVYYDVRLSTDPLGAGSTIISAKFDPDNTVYQNNTMGNSSFFKGINKSFFIFGGGAKTSLSFEWGKYDDKYYSLETGVMVDAFPAPVPIFATIKNDQVFVNLYLCFTYGTRK